MVDSSKPKLGRVSETYMSMVADRIEPAVKALLQGSSGTVSLSAASGMARNSVNRRKYYRRYISRRILRNTMLNAPNKQGCTDETLITATLRAEDGAPVAIVWNYACHPVGRKPRNAVSAQFPGAIRERIRRSEGQSELPVLYFQGFSGNTRPSATIGSWRFRDLPKQLLNGLVFSNMSDRRYSRWVSNLAKRVDQTRACEKETPVDSIATKRVTIPASELYTEQPGEVSFVRLDLGSQFTLIGMSGEVVAEYAQTVRAIVDRPFVACAGCLDTPTGYVPVHAMLSEGGYEAQGFCQAFNVRSVQPSIEENVHKGFHLVSSGSR